MSVPMLSGSRRWSALIDFLKNRFAAETSRLAQLKLGGIPGGIGSPVKALSFFADFHVSLVGAARRAAHLQVCAHSLVDLRRVAVDPPEDGDLIYRQPALAHHLLLISVA